MINNKLFNKSNKIKESIILNISRSLPFNKPKLKLIKTPFNIFKLKQFQIQQKLLYFITKTIPKKNFRPIKSNPFSLKIFKRKPTVSNFPYKLEKIIKKNNIVSVMYHEIIY